MLFTLKVEYGYLKKNPYFCLIRKYKICRKETRAIVIESLTTIYGEQEVFLIPVSVFRVISVDHDRIEMKAYAVLEDCELPTERDALAPIVRCGFAEFSRNRIAIAIAQVCEWICYKKHSFPWLKFF